MPQIKFWTEEKNQIITDKFKNADLEKLANELGCTILALRNQAQKLKIKRVEGLDWSENDLKYLKSNFSKTDNKELSDYFKKSETAIRSMAFKLGLKKDKWAWKVGEEKYVAENYGKLTIEEMITHLGKTKWAIINKYRELNGLKKSGGKAVISEFNK